MDGGETVRILVTGSRAWTDHRAIAYAIAAHVPITWDQELDMPRGDWASVTIVHGACRTGADRHAARLADALGMATEPHPARDHADPKARNAYMVSLGADVCLAFATRWASGTGNCARLARRAGIETIDHGVSTRIEDRP